MSMQPRDFLFLDKMITPTIITVIYWILSVAVILVGFLSMFQGGLAVLTGLLTVLIGPVIVRMYCEIVIVFFKINDNIKALGGKNEQ